MSNNIRIKLITTNTGVFNAAQLVAIVLFLMHHKGICYDVVRTNDYDTGCRVTRDDLESIFHTGKYVIANDYVGLALGRDVTPNDTVYINRFIHRVYTDIIEPYAESQPERAVTSGLHEFTISDVVKYMNISDTESDEQNINFHKSLSILHDWLDIYMLAVAREVIRPAEHIQ